MKLVALIMLVAPSIGRTEPRRYVEADVLFGAAEPVIGWNIMPSIDGGYRFSDTFWFHAGAGFGPTISNLGTHGPNHGSNSLARAGIEMRWRASAMVALIAGIDLGVTHGTWGHDRLADREHAMHRLYSDALHAESVDVGVWQKVGTNDAGPEHVITPLGPVWIEAASSPEAS